MKQKLKKENEAQKKISEHFSKMGKKSWEKRKAEIIGSDLTKKEENLPN